MALVEVNGHGVVDGRIWFPRTGAWHAELRVDSTDPVTGAVTISIADGRLVLRGTVWRGAEYVDTSFLNIVGGAGGLRSIARARAYTQTSLRIVLGDLLAGAGEKLSPTSDAATLARPLAAWTTPALPVGQAIARALRSAAPTASWRVLPDGTIWVGPETWPDSGLTTDDYQIMDEDPRQLTAELGVEAPVLLPGTTLAGRRVSRVEHVIGAEGVRSIVWFEDTETGAAPSADRLKDAFSAAVRSAAGLDFNALYWARVIAQRGSTIDVEPENPTIAKFLPSEGGVPLLMPAPGATVAMAATGRVLIGWSGSDPARPYAIGYDANTVATELVLNVITSLILGGEAGAEPVIKGTSFASALSTFLFALTTYAGAIQSIADPSGLATTALGTAATAFTNATTAALAAKTKVS